MSGPAWQQLKAAADGDLGTAEIADQNSNHDVRTLAVALVYARTGDSAYRAKAADAEAQRELAPAVGGLAPLSSGAFYDYVECAEPPRTTLYVLAAGQDINDLLAAP